MHTKKQTMILSNGSIQIAPLHGKCWIHTGFFTVDINSLNKIYIFHTRVGPFKIVQNGARFDIMFEGDSLGSYATAEMAAEDLAGGHTFTPSSGIDPFELGISPDLSDWEERLE